MKAYVTLNEKESFSKKRCSELGDVMGKVNLSNGAEYDITFFIHHELIVISRINKTSIVSQKEQEEEKMAIIEEILDKYTTSKPILKPSMNYDIEQYKLLECSSDINVENVRDIVTLQKKVSNNDDILAEYIKSDYSKTSFNVVFRALNEIYHEMMNLVLSTNSSKDQKKCISIKTGYQFSHSQKSDLEQYACILLANIVIMQRWNNCRVKYNKNSQSLNIELD